MFRFIYDALERSHIAVTGPELDKILLIITTPSLAPGKTQLPIQLVPGTFPQGEERRASK